MSNIIQIDGKYYDFGTTNTSFLLTAQELKAVGVKKYYLMLEVKYPHLGVQDIDPFKPDITPEEIGKIHLESKANIWYWLREVARIPAQGAPQPYQLCLTRASCAAAWCFEHNIDFILNQPRQTWKTTIALLLSVHMFVYDFKNVTIPFMHLKEEKCIKNVEMFRDYVTTLPAYMNPWYNLKRPPGIKSLKYTPHGTSITIVSSADNEVNAKDKLRGNTLFGALIDEWEYLPYINHVLAGASPAMVSGRVIAAKTNGRVCMMYTSTPGNLDTETGKAAQNIIDNTPYWTEEYYDMTDEEIIESFDGAFLMGDDGMKIPVSRLFIEYDYKQLRKDDSWLKIQYDAAIASGDIDEYRRGILLQRYRGSSDVLFQQSDMDYIINNLRKPDYDIFLMKKYHLYCYKHDVELTDIYSDTPYFDINIPYLIGMDIASGGGGDNTAICILHPYTMEVVGELKSPFMGSLDQMRVITVLAKMIPKAIFCVETNNIGKAIVDFVQESSLESRFYHDPKLDMSKNATQKKTGGASALKTKSSNMKYIGLYVTNTTRTNMFDILKRHMKDYHHLLVNRFLSQDIQALVKMKSGKIAAATGEHDDMVMAYLHTVYTLYYGYDLNRFGIDKKLCVFEKALTIINDYEKEQQEDLVDNMKPYSNGYGYEEQLLRDKIKTDAYAQNTVDEDRYGYTNNTYSRSEMKASNVDHFEDVAFFTSVNQQF